MLNASHDRIIDELYQAHRAAVLRVCSRILRNADDAADATQEVFVIAIESLDRSAKPGVARAWLLTVARNHCLDLLRRRKRLGKALVTLGPDDERGRDLEAAVADRDFVDIVFKLLSKRERQALWQSAVESRPLADIASGLRLSYMAAAQVLHRARRHAVQAAARVAVALGIVQLGRQRTGAGPLLNAQRLAAVAAVPLIAAVSLNASSPIPSAASASTAHTAVFGAPPALAGGSQSPQLALPQNGTPGSGTNPNSLIPGTTGTVNSVTDSAGRLLQSPLPSVPPVLRKPPALPSIPPLPSPPTSPGVP